MKHQIEEVWFPAAVADKVYARDITEEDVLEALTADSEMGEREVLLLRRVAGRRGGEGFWALCQVPRSGRYLSVGVEVMPDGTACCFHALDMSRSQQRLFRKHR
jgi:hypothetical protein